MAKKGRMLARVKAWMTEYAYLVTLGCVLGIVVGCALYTQELRSGMQEGVEAAAPAPETQEQITQSPTPAITPLPTIAPLAVRPAALVSGRAAWPVEGEILRVFDAQQAVYWPVLQTWKAHEGIDIAGQAGQTVQAAESGAVTDSAWDELWGWRVSIEQADGRIWTYAGLESCIVHPGMDVMRGQPIGTLLAEVPCEAEMGAHLHLACLRSGTWQDPEASLMER